MNPETEAAALAADINAAAAAALDGASVDAEPLGERVRALTEALHQTPPENPERAAAAREGLEQVITALDGLEAALVKQVAAAHAAAKTADRKENP